ncbi:response regulator transcription factor [Acidovorax sp.]|jgi:two-component system, OmpR family, phosphate regulon response regulator PhoB|uniref:response regulator transcription factor n=1 Tax=Acidovorax sp. TaxID=1872122 RepID=UPI00391F71EC
MKKVLIVEDHMDIRKLLHMTMEFEDFEIHEAANGDIGLEMARALSPDVVLLDVMMPGTLSGLEVCRCIKSNPALKHTKVIMLTARGQAQDRRDGLKAGADAYLVKPFSTLQVLETVYRLEAAHAPTD